MPRPKKGEAPANKTIPNPLPVMVPAPIATAPVPVAAPTYAAPQMAAAPPLPMDTRAIDYQQFIRIRDSVLSRLSTIQNLVREFSADYLRQTNMLIGEPTAVEPSSLQALASLDQAGLSFGAPIAQFAPPVEEKKERKKRQHDPNAPKRPLTPYFLYMQTARPIIAADLGAEAPKGAVQEEGQRRWASMGPVDKQAWNNAYQFNLRLYNARVHSYKAGNAEARNMDDQQALAYADANSIPLPAATEVSGAAATEQDAIAEQLMSAAGPTPAADDAKTPKAKANSRKRKSGVADAEEGEASAAKPSTPASPDKKRKRASKAADVTEEPKKSGRKKKST